MIVICGGGMAGVAAAYHLAVRHGRSDVVLVDEREPLSLTSAAGTEAYRNWWPNEVMSSFVGRSIDLLEEIAPDLMVPRGYVFLAREAASLPLQAPGAGTAELVVDREEILARYPFLTPEVGAMLHVPRAGWLDTRALGRRLLDACVEAGVRVVRERVETMPDADAFVIAAGPYLRSVGAMVGVELPVVCELHAKLAFPQDVVPDDAPMMIWEDGVHFRPRGSELLGIWTRDAAPVVMDEPVYPPPFDPGYASKVLRRLGLMVPGLEKCSPGVVDGGYYCRTAENRPLIGPVRENVFVIGALSGFGVMASQAAGELLALHVVGGALPDYADAFAPTRFDDPDYVAPEVADGQL